MHYNPDVITAATRAMCRELYGDNFDLHDHGAQDPEGRASLERAAEAAVEAYLEQVCNTPLVVRDEDDTPRRTKMEHVIVVQEEVLPLCSCGYSPPSPTNNVEGLWRAAISHVDQQKIRV